MKKNMKRFTSMLLTSAMVMGMGLTTFAAPETTTLTINGVEGHTYYAYQMLTGELSGLGANGSGTGTLANIEPGFNLKDCAKAEGEADGVINKTDATAFETAIKDLSGTELSSTAMGYIKENTAAYINTDEANSYSLSVPTGYYVVIDRYKDSNKDCAAYMVAVAGPTTMNPKTDIPDIDKKIVDEDANAAIDESKKTDTAAIGDTINYELTSKVPVTTGYKYYYYIVNDTLSKGLTLTENTFSVQIGTTVLERGDETDNKDYRVYVTHNDDGTTSFKLAIMDLKQFEAGKDIVITYDAVVNENAKIGTEANTNTVSLSYSNNPEDTLKYDKDDDDDKPGIPDEPGEGETPNPGSVLGETPDRVTKTYVTELTIYKVDENNAALNGATFELTGTNLNKVRLTTTTAFVAAETAGTGEYYKLLNGQYTKTAPVTEEEGKTSDKYETLTPDYNLVVTVSEDATAVADSKVSVELVNGVYTITGLNAGSYTLTETVTPDGYNTVDPINFTITAGQTGSTTSVGGDIVWGKEGTDAAKINLSGTGVYDTTVINVKGNLLPSTGGIGTTIFYVMGTILSLGAGVILVAKKRIAR